MALRTTAALILALPLAGAECADLTQPGGGGGGGDGAGYDGTYILVSVDGKPIPQDIIFVDANNHLRLTQGQWIISGTSLTTKMWTTSYVNGVPKSDPKFNPEVHTCTVTISGETASCTLDSGSSISASVSGGAVVQSSSGHVLRFEK